MSKHILAADIGGTNSRFAYFEVNGDDSLTLRDTTWIPSRESRSFDELLDQLHATSFPIRADEADMVVVAAAGPVEKGRYCFMTNVNWGIDFSNAKTDFGIERYALIGDFFAQAYGCRSPISSQAAMVLSGESHDDGAVAVVGAGTGLGKAVLVPDGKGHFVARSSEGGHVYFTPEDEQESGLDRFIAKKAGIPHATWEDVVSGRGLSYIHEYLTGVELKPADVAATFSADSKTLAWSSSFYGRVCRNYALEVIATGGLYIAGGVAAKNPILIKHESFEQAFRTSHVHGRLLSEIPVMLVDNEENGLWGAAYYGKQQLVNGQ